MKYLFVYGTLLSADIMQRVSGLTGLQSTPALVEGYCRYRIRGESYPAIVPVEGSSVEGRLCYPISREGWLRLDRFEGEMYSRKLVKVIVDDDQLQNAFVYILKPSYHSMLEPREWDFDEFLRAAVKSYLV